METRHMAQILHQYISLPITQTSAKSLIYSQKIVTCIHSHIGAIYMSAWGVGVQIKDSDLYAKDSILLTKMNI